MDKTATEIATDADVLEAAQNNQIKREALKSILWTLGGFGAVGMGARALTGRSYLFGSPVDEEEKLRKKRHAPSQIVPLPYPVAKSALFSRTVTAGQPLPPKNFWRGDHETSKGGLPWFAPLWALAALGGLGAGYKLTDKWLDKRRRDDLGEDVETAESEYRRALLSQYTQPKQANAQEAPSVGDQIGTALDDAYAALSKQALMGHAAGLGLTLATILALGTGYLSHQAAKARSPGKLLEEAYKRREREKARARPPEIVIAPVPVRGSTSEPIALPA
jgi:hypothetical protein